MCTYDQNYFRFRLSRISQPRQLAVLLSDRPEAEVDDAVDVLGVVLNNVGADARRNRP